jgi:hypothetical protein
MCWGNVKQVNISAVVSAIIVKAVTTPQQQVPHPVHHVRPVPTRQRVHHLVPFVHQELIQHQEHPVVVNVQLASICLSLECPIVTLAMLVTIQLLVLLVARFAQRERFRQQVHRDPVQAVPQAIIHSLGQQVVSQPVQRDLTYLLRRHAVIALLELILLWVNLHVQLAHLVLIRSVHLQNASPHALLVLTILLVDKCALNVLLGNILKRLDQRRALTVH